MKINPMLFDHKGRMQLGSGYPTDVKWHPLYAEDEAYHYIAASYNTGEVKLFHVEVGNDGIPKSLSVDHTFTLAEPSICNCLDWSPDGHYIVGGFSYRYERLHLFDIYTNQQMDSFNVKQHINSVRNVSFSSDGKTIFYCLNKGEIHICDSRKGKPVINFNSDNHGAGFNGFSVHPDDSKIVTVHPWDHNLHLWDAKTGKRIPGFDGKGHTGSVFSATFSPDGQIIASASYSDSSLRLWESQKGTQLLHFEVDESERFFFGHGAGPTALSFSSDCRFIVFGADFNLRILDVEKGDLVPDFDGKGSSKHIQHVSFCPEGKIIASGVSDGTLQLWDGQKGRSLATFGTKKEENLICLFNLKNGATIIKNLPERASLLNLVVFPDNRRILYSSHNRTLMLWDSKTGKIIHDFDLIEYSGNITIFSISPDLQTFATQAPDGNRLRLWNIQKGVSLRDFNGQGHTNRIDSICFSPDGKTIVTGSDDSTVRLWDANTGNPIKDFNGKGHESFNHSVSFSPDGKTIASSSLSSKSSNHGLILRDAIYGKKTIHFGKRKYNNYGFENISYSPDGQMVAASLDKCFLSIFDVKTGEIIVNIPILPGPFSFSLDGRCIIHGKCFLSTIILKPNLIINLEKVLGSNWLKEHLSTPLILTGVWFPKGTLEYLQESKQGTIVPNRPLARCGECGLFFPVEDNMLGKDIGCPNKIGKVKRCNRLVKLNEFTAGNER